MEPLSLKRSQIRLVARGLMNAIEADAAIGRQEQLCG